jgi:GNAT superfamily N-acetyltransferase
VPPSAQRLRLQLQDEAIAWLATKGTDQWQPTAPRNPHRTADRALAPSIERGEVYLVRKNGEVAATFTLDDYADPEFWTEDDDPSSALYVHRMVASRAAAGAGIGAAILDWCAAEARRRGKRWLRLDAWRTNKSLHTYYKRHGFTPVRDINLSHRGSGSLFQRPV